MWSSPWSIVGDLKKKSCKLNPWKVPRVCRRWSGLDGTAVHAAYWPPFFIPDRMKLKKNLTAKTDVTLTLFPIRFHYLPFYCIFLPFYFTTHTINIFIFYGWFIVFGINYAPYIRASAAWSAQIYVYFGHRNIRENSGKPSVRSEFILFIAIFVPNDLS